MGGDLAIRVGGESGEGIISTGELITKAAAEASLYVMTYRTYPAEIVGGPALYQVRIADSPLLTHGDTLDVLVAFNEEAYERHTPDLKPGAVLIWDSSVFAPPDGAQYVRYPIPLSELARSKVGRTQSKNMVALGAVGQLFSLPQDALEEAIVKRFARKGSKIVESNLNALRAGIEFVTSEVVKQDGLKMPYMTRQRRMVLAGNQAISLGVVASGCRFVTGYPITPASDILEWLADELPKLGGVVAQCEDEMASLAACIGASFAGKKAFTCTSGPGLSLMTELFNLAGMAEVPVVIADIQRAGPSTGMPTKTEQSDLDHAMFGGHGEAPRVVIAPANVRDCFDWTLEAFNIAEEYQVPVIILSDMALSSRTEGIEPVDPAKIRVRHRKLPGADELRNYERYAFTASGVSPMAVPGIQGGEYAARGIEHDPRGVPSYEPATHREMTAKRFRKLDALAKKLPPPPRYGHPEPEIGIIGWGSTEGAIREAINWCEIKKYRVASLHPRVLSPLPEQAISEFLKPLKRVIVPELNYTGQFARIVRSKFGVDVMRVNVCEGRPFKVREIFAAIEEAYR
jgi:2-oxoglutarate ferredoxin oxidoreductase subunit alpha